MTTWKELGGLMRELKEVMGRFPHRDGDIDVYVMSDEMWEKLKAHFPRADRPPPEAPLGMQVPNSLRGIPIFVYHSPEERVTIIQELLDLGKYVGEVE